MKASEFRERLREAYPAIPPEIDIELGKFISFDEGVLSSSNLRHEDRNFLRVAGLPEEASPFLDFTAYAESHLANRLSVIPEGNFPIGSNGYGDVLAIDCSSGEIVYFNHDFDNKRVLVSSSLPQFAEALCIYQECATADQLNVCLQKIQEIDPPAATPGTMWFNELRKQKT